LENDTRPRRTPSPEARPSCRCTLTRAQRAQDVGNGLWRAAAHCSPSLLTLDHLCVTAHARGAPQWARCARQARPALTSFCGLYLALVSEGLPRSRSSGSPHRPCRDLATRPATCPPNSRSTASHLAANLAVLSSSGNHLLSPTRSSSPLLDNSSTLCHQVVQSSPVQSSPVQSSRVESSRVESSRVESSRVESSRVQSSPVQSSQ